jgi:hypothetical protein
VPRRTFRRELDRARAPTWSTRGRKIRPDFESSPPRRGPSHSLDLPRLGSTTWTSTQDCGWVRYTFDHQDPLHALERESSPRAAPPALRRHPLPDTWGNLTSIERHRSQIRTPCIPRPPLSQPGIPTRPPTSPGDGLGAHPSPAIRGGGGIRHLSGGVLPVEAGFVWYVLRRGSTPGSVLRARSCGPNTRSLRP